MKGSRRKLFSLSKVKTINVKQHWPLFLIAGVVFIFFWRVFFLNQVALPADFIVGTYYPWLDYKWGYAVGVPVKNPILADVVSFSYPMRVLAVEMLKTGKIPLWNPYILTGIPLLANFQSAPFTLTNIFYFIFEVNTAWNMQIIFQHFLASVFMYFLLRYWKVSQASSIFGSVIYAFSGFNLIWSQWNAHTLAAAFLPLLVLFTARWFDGAKPKFLFAFSLVLMLQIFSGYPQIVMYSAFCVFLYVLMRFTFSKDYLIKFLFLTVFAVLGVGMSMVQVLPGYELLKYSQRATEPLEYEMAFLPLSKIITFIAPDYFGNHATGNYWGPGDYTTTTGYVGTIAAVFVGYSFIKKRKRDIFALLVLIAGLLLSFPTPLSVLIWKLGLFGFQAASAHRALVLFTFSVSILASIGLDNFINSKKSISSLLYLIVPAVILVIFAVYALDSMGYQILKHLGIKPIQSGNAQIALRNLIFPSLIFIITSILFTFRQKINQKAYLFFIPLLIIELFRFGWKFTPFSPRNFIYPPTPVIEFLLSEEKPFRVTTTDVIPINIKMPYKLESLEGYDAIYPLDIAKFLGVLNSGDLTADPQGRYGMVTKFDSHFLDLVNTKYLLLLKRDDNGKPSETGSIPEKYKTGKYNIAFEDKTVTVVEIRSVLSRAFMVYDWEIAQNPTEVLEKILNQEYPIKDKIILNESPEFKINRDKGFSRVTYKVYEDAKSIIEVDTQNDGFLFVSDLYYPGWKSYVDGVETRIYKTDYTFRGILVPAGLHTVEFIYKPQSFAWGLRLSVLSLSTTIFLIIFLKNIAKINRLKYLSQLSRNR